MSPAQDAQEKSSSTILKERRFKLSRCVTIAVVVPTFADPPLGHAIAVGERLQAGPALHHAYWILRTAVGE